MEKDQNTNKKNQQNKSIKKKKIDSKKIDPRLPYKTPIDDFLVDIRQKEEEKQTEAKAKKFNLPYIYLIGMPIPQEALDTIPEDIAKKYKIVPFLKIDKKVSLAMIDPQASKTNEIIKKIEQSLGYNFDIVLASKSSLTYALKLYKLFASEKIKEDKNQIEVKYKTPEKFEKEIKTLKQLKEKITSVSTTEIVDTILGGAVALYASDIHIEPHYKNVKVRYRIDGILQDVISFPRKIFPFIVSRIKFLARMKIDVTRIPQDGRFYIMIKDRKIDIRTATLPCSHGENIELRLFDQEVEHLSLDQLGIEKTNFNEVSQNIQKTSGMILVCGPTGSGKTTTLYAILETLNKEQVKIITLEDPIEYHLPGIIQSQVDAEVKYDFKNGLRSILRQDPDILMIGEIRDFNTADMAVHAGLTGHVVLTTLHTNDASGALPRMIDMGIKAYLLISSVNAIISQRLVRKICDKCKKEYQPNKQIKGEIERIFKNISQKNKKGVKIGKFYKGAGCDFCNNTGYKGRIGIFEVLTLNDEIKNLTLDISSTLEIKKSAIKSGMITLEQDGILKVLNGITTPEEVWRVTKE